MNSSREKKLKTLNKDLKNIYISKFNQILITINLIKIQSKSDV
jgi:hypothetical protein